MAELTYGTSALANGTAITNNTIANTAGNGHAVTVGISGGAATDRPMVAQSGGIDFYGLGSDIRRIDTAVFPSSLTYQALRMQFVYYPRQHPVGAAERIAQGFSTAAAQMGILHINTTGVLGMNIGTGGPITGSTSPAINLNQRWLIDLVQLLHTSPTTSNGRGFWRVKAVDDPTWNSSAGYFYSNHTSQNIGTAQFSKIRYGKQATSAIDVATPFRISGVRWEGISYNIAHTTEAESSAYFLSDPFASVPNPDGYFKTEGGLLTPFDWKRGA